MLYGLFVALFAFICVLLILVILIQQGKGSIGIGGLGGQTQMLFGGSGGQDVFQKTTWILGALFMIGSLVLTLHKSATGGESRYLRRQLEQAQQQTAPAPIEKTMTEESAAE